MSLSLSRGPRLVRSISTTAARAKKLGVPDKQERDRYKQEQEKKQKERLLAAKQARDRGEDWSGDSGYDPDATRIILDRKAGPHFFNKWPENLKGKVEGPGKVFNDMKPFGPASKLATSASFPQPPAPEGQTEKLDVITQFGVPRNIELDFALLTKPASVIRQSTLDVMAALDMVGQPDTTSNPERIIISGQKGCGKSYTLLQAVWHAVNNGWVVVYVPRAIDLVTNISDYVYDRRQQIFMQNQASAKLLKSILLANPNIRKAISGSLITKMETSLIEPNEPAELLQQVLIALGSNSRIPVLFAVDEMQALFSTSWYKDPYFKPIEAHHLSIPRILVDFASGKQTFHKGMFLGAYSQTNTQWPIPLVLREAAGVPHDKPEGPYSQRPSHHIEYAKMLKGWHIPNAFSRQEAAAAFELWQNAKAIAQTNTDRTFMNALAVSGGNPRAFVRDGLLYSLDT